jgi:hypothetical protein
MAVDQWPSQMQQRVIELVKADELTDYQLTDYQRDVLIELLELCDRDKRIVIPPDIRAAADAICRERRNGELHAMKVFGNAYSTRFDGYLDDVCHDDDEPTFDDG